MTKKQRQDIVKIGKDFLSGFEGTFNSINGTGWMVVDPLSGYLNSIGIQNKLFEIPETDERPQVLVMEFLDGSKLVPAGEDLKGFYPEVSNWMWILKKTE